VPGVQCAEGRVCEDVKMEQQISIPLAEKAAGFFPAAFFI